MVVFVVAIFGLMSVVQPTRVYAANVTWDGGGSDGSCGGNAGDGNKWSCGENWSTNSIPAAADTAIFDSTSTKAATIDSNISITAININSGYSGTITQNAGVTITLSSTNSNTAFSQAAGTFVGGDSSITLSTGGFTLSGGSFTSTSGTFSIGRNFTVSGGSFAHNSGNISFVYTTQASVITCGSATFNTVSFNKSNAASVTVSNGCTVPILGTNPSSSSDVVNNGTITVTGDWTISGSYTANAGSILTMSGSILTSSESMTLNGGTFPAGITTLFVGGTFNDAGNTVPDNIALTLNQSTNSSLNCGDAVFSSITIDKSSGSTVTPTGSCVTADFSLLAGIIANPASSYTWSIAGNFLLDVSSSSQFFGGGNLPVVFNGSGTQNITQVRGPFRSPFTVSKATGTAVLLTDFFTTTTQTCTVSQGKLNLNGHNLICSSTFTINSGATLEAQGHEYFTTPTIQSSAIITYTGRTNSIVDSLALPELGYKNLTINTSESGDIFDSRNLLDTNLVGHWKMEAGSGSVDDSSTNSNAASLAGNATYSGTVPTLTGESNSYSMSFDGSGDYLNPGSNLGILANTKGITLSAWIRKNTNSAQDQIVGFSTNGSNSNSRAFMQTNGSALECAARAADSEALQTVATAAVLSTSTWYHVVCVIDYPNDVIAIYLNGVLQATDIPPSFTQNNTDNTTSQNSSIGIDEDKIGGDFDGLIDEVRVYNRALSSSEALALGSGKNTNAITNTLSIAGNMTITSGVLYPPSSLSVSGNWSNNGTFNHNSGTVILDGAGQSISGDTTFYNLTKQTSSTDTLTFQANKTQIIAGTLTLEGAISNVLSLRSSSTGTQWRINPQGTRTIQYLSVRDSNNINAAAMSVNGFNITDATNNTNWGFASEEPALSLTPLSPDPNSDSTPSITGTANDDVGTVALVEYQMDGTGGSWSSCTAQDGTFDEISESFSCTVGSSLSDGSHTIYVRATDDENNVTASVDAATDSFTIDTGAPSISLTEYTPDPNNDTTPTISGNATDTYSNVQAVEYQVDGTGGSWTSCTASDGSFSGSSENFTCTISPALSDGAHSIYVRATDSLGNITSNGSAASDNFTIDSTPPTIPGTPVATTGVNDSTPTWQWAQSTDTTAGMSATTAYTLQWSKSATFSSGVSTHQVGTNSCSSGTCTYTNTSTLTDGTWYFRVKATDLVGNESSYSNNGSHFIDNTNPTITLTAISPDPGTNAAPTLTGTATDSSSTVASVQYQVDNTSGSWSNCTADDGTFDEQSEAFSCTISPDLTGGTHTIYTRAQDSSENYSSNILAHRDTYSVDLSAPSISLTALSPDPTSDTTPTFTGTASEDTATVSAVQYQVDSTSGTWRNCTASDGAFDETSEDFSCTTITQTNGAHTLYVRATDSTGNTTIGALAATDSFTVDITAPSITLTPVSPDPGADTTPTLAGTATDSFSSVSAVQFQLDGTGGAWSNCTADDGTFDETSEAFSCTVGSPLSDGTYTLYVRATDALSNTTANNNASTDTFIVDTTTSSISLTALSPDPTSDTTPTLTGSVSDTAAVITAMEFQMDGTGGGWSSCSADDGAFDEQSENFSCTSGTLTHGSHTMYVRATNANASTTASAAAPSDTFTVDITAPAVSVTALSPDPNSDTTPTFTGSVTDTASSVTALQYQVDSTGGAWTNCSATDGGFNELSENFSCNVGAALSDGAHTIYFRATDALSNTTSSSYSSDSFTISTSAPAITVTPLSPDPTSDTTPSITATVTSQYSTVTAVEYQVGSTSGNWSSCTADDGTFDESSEAVTCTSGTALSQGAHTLYIRSTDAVGVTTPNNGVSSDTFTVDTSGPVLTLSALVPDPTSDTTPTFSGRATDLYSTIAGVSYQVDSTGGAWSSCTPNDSSFNTDSENYNCTTAALSYGAHTIYVRATDSLGNVTSVGSYRQDSFTLDASAPAVASAPTGGVVINTTGTTNPTYTSSRSVILDISALDSESANNLLSMRVSESNSFSDTTIESYSSSKNFTLSSGEGTKRVYVQLQDPDELTSETYSDTIIYDATAPTGLELNEPAANSSTTALRVNFKFKVASDSLAGLQKYQVVVDDAVLFDDISPSKPDGSSERSDSTKIVSYDGSYISVKANSASGELKVGKHTWQVKAYDVAGNVSTTGAREFTIDQTTPDIQLIHIGTDAQTITTATPAGKIFAVAEARPTFGGTAEVGSTVTISETGVTICQAVTQSDGNWSCSSEKALSTGRHTITITATDTAGNSSSLPVVYLFIGSDTLQLSTSVKALDNKSETEAGKENTATTESPDVIQTPDGPKKVYDIKVVVRDEQDKPIAGAKVTLFSTPREGVTDQNGEVLFAAVEEGDHTVVIDHNNAVGKRGITIEGASKTIEVKVVVTEKNPFTIPVVALLIGGLSTTLLVLTWLLFGRNFFKRIK